MSEGQRRQPVPGLRADGSLPDRLLASVAEGVWAASADGTEMLYLNPAIGRIYGRPNQEFFDNPNLWIEVIHPEDRPGAEQSVREMFEGGTTECEYRILRPDGTEHWVLERKGVVVDENRRPLHIGGIVIDITDRKQIEERLRRSTARLEAALEALTGGVWDWNIATGQVDFTPSWARMLGYEPDEIVGHVRTWEQALHPDDKPAVTKMLGDHFTKNSLYQSEHRLRTKSGEWIWVLGRGHVTEWDARGKPSRMIGSDIDISSRKQAEQQGRRLETKIQEAQKLESLGLLAGGIAHDFNNILTTVLGNAELAQLSLPEAAPAREQLEQVKTASRRAASLCKQLLAYSGRGRFDVRAVDISALVEEMAHLLEVSISKNVRLDFDFAKKLPAIEMDVTQVRQVVMNLITNASDAIGDADGVISIRTGVMRASHEDLSAVRFGERLKEGAYVCLEVSDTGCGMDEEMMVKIFDPFFSTKSTGRGLGLAAVVGIVRGHGGAIKLRSRPGKGTTFTVILPPSARAAEPIGRVTAPSSQWRGEGTILVVDDEPGVRALAESILHSRGFEVLTASDGREALAVYRERSRDIVAVLLDLTMPNVGGEECFRELRRVDPRVKVVLSSGYNEQDLGRLHAKGFAGFIQKPYRQSEFVEKFRTVLEP